MINHIVLPVSMMTGAILLMIPVHLQHLIISTNIDTRTMRKQKSGPWPVAADVPCRRDSPTAILGTTLRLLRRKNTRSPRYRNFHRWHRTPMAQIYRLAQLRELETPTGSTIAMELPLLSLSPVHYVRTLGLRSTTTTWYCYNNNNYYYYYYHHCY